MRAMAKKLDLITTISEKEKSSVWLMADENGDFLIMKKICGEEKLELYRKLQEANSPFFPKILEVYAEDGKTVVLEEWLEGEELARMTDGEMDAERAFDYARQLIMAIQTLHHLNPPLIHRDVKPENILITKEGQLKLLDFDAAREWLGEGKERDTILLGTRGYAAPEQFGYSQTDARTDLYSVGIVCAGLFEKASWPKWQKKRIKTFLDKATMFDPDERFQTAEEMGKALEKVRTGRRTTCIAGTAVFLLILGMIWIAFGVWRGKELTEKPVEPEATMPVSKLTDLDVLPAAYRQKSIGSRVRNADATMRAADLAIPYDAEGAAGFFSEDRECAIGTEYPVLRFLKAYPQAILFYDYRVEEQGSATARLTRYSEGGSKEVDHVEFSCEMGKSAQNGLICLRTADLERLQTGIYRLDFCFPKGLTLSYYLQVHGAEEEVDGFAIRMTDPIQYYSESIKNDVLFYAYNTPENIEKIYCNGEEIPKDQCLFTADQKGVILQEDFFQKFQLGEILEICFEMKNQRKAYGKVILLP